VRKFHGLHDYSNGVIGCLGSFSNESHASAKSELEPWQFRAVLLLIGDRAGAAQMELDSSSAQEATRVYDGRRVFEVKKEIRVESWCCEGSQANGDASYGRAWQLVRLGIIGADLRECSEVVVGSPFCPLTLLRGQRAKLGRYYFDICLDRVLFNLHIDTKKSPITVPCIRVGPVDVR